MEFNKKKECKSGSEVNQNSDLIVEAICGRVSSFAMVRTEISFREMFALREKSSKKVHEMLQTPENARENCLRKHLRILEIPLSSNS